MSNLAKIKDMDSEGARKKEKVAPKFGTFKNSPYLCGVNNHEYEDKDRDIATAETV